MLILLLQVAFAGSQWEGRDASIKVERVIMEEPAEIYAELDDLQDLSEIYAAACVRDWALAGQTEGVGARGRVTYHLSKLRRRLTVTISKAELDRYVELDHLSAKGFVTRWLLQENEAGTLVSLETFINPPPWPFRGYYFKNIQPEWQRCYETTLDNLEASLGPS
jgi:hypothetical protein